MLFTACVRPPTIPAPTPQPESIPLETEIQATTDPARAASLRLVEEGKTELKKSRFERAAQLFSRAVEIDRKNPYAFFYLAVVRFRTVRFAQAAELFQRSGDLFTDDPTWRAEAYAFAGESLEKLSKGAEAIAAYDRALETDSENQRARNGVQRLRGS